MPKKEKQGVVVSDKMQKTVVVKVADFNAHPKYKKIIETTKNYKVNDPKSICKVGDLVRIIESRPTSKDKRWDIVQVVQKAN